MFRGSQFLAAVLASLLGATAALAADDTGRERLKDPAVQLAETVSKRVEREEGVWEKVTSDLKDALDTYTPGPLGLAQEQKVLKAFREYVKQQLDDGRKIVSLYEKWTMASASLAEVMKKAPGYYREAAKQYREYAAEAKFKDNKERYLLVADTWEALARQAQGRVKELDLDANPGGLLDYLKESNTFLERFIDTIDALPRSSQEATAEYQQLLDKLRKHAEKYDQLKKNLKLFRDKIGAGAFNPEVRDRIAAEGRLDQSPRMARINEAIRRARVDALGYNSSFWVSSVNGQFAALAQAPTGNPKVGQNLPFVASGSGGLRTGTVRVVSLQQGYFVVRILEGRLFAGDIATVAA
jgi:hypothetical protein